MRQSLVWLLALVLTLVGAYVYSKESALCQVPIHYSIGQLDDRFNLSEAQARQAIAEAAGVWESATGEDLFQYTPGATELVVNFLFDERQARAEAEESLRQNLDEQQHETETIGETYSDLTTRYQEAKAVYQQKLKAYETRLTDYNQTVAKYNAEGGAPPGVYQQLQKEAEDLDDESDELNRLARSLNDLVEDINSLSEEGNQIIEDYNEDVERYNRSFGEATEFTQGDYSRNAINIYKFIDQHELELVLAHELGHALNLEHVEGPESIMYYLMGGQPQNPVLSDADVAEFTTVCQNNNLLFGFLPFNF